LPLIPGTRLGVYDITAPIGEGGMGQVYRARDTKLDRDVTIKILPEAFAQDAELVARFTREAKTLAPLNHPHIAAIYGLEESAGITALVMDGIYHSKVTEYYYNQSRPAKSEMSVDRNVTTRRRATSSEQRATSRRLKWARPCRFAYAVAWLALSL
jgi:serine/threonine protein kinase